MTNEEAIKCVDDVLLSDYHYDETLGYQLTSDDFDWLETAKSALEKQIPKKATPDKKYYGNGKCPDCGVVFINKETNYCGNCGKRLLWESDTE